MDKTSLYHRGNLATVDAALVSLGKVLFVGGFRLRACSLSECDVVCV